ncbi:unnamed protein product [Protopolystoma xenopodis]|uniref:Uncharacterized protein n=1 Tax=Protopolystoma xenopodis TaxID=117903 RepID=A0A3S5AVA8_9PLAT|nr:unnamed protein product [Protopolystoma xenopodis]
MKFKTAICLKALRTHIDSYNKPRRNGEKWLLTLKDTDSHIIGVNEELVSTVRAITLTAQQYAFKLNPINENGVCQLGKKQLIRGECSFFLHPGEELEAGVEDVYILSQNEGLVLKATEQITIGSRTYSPGEKWLIQGPMEYVPPVSVEVVCCRTSIPLDKSEGIYVRNTRSGRVRAIIGSSYLLNEDEDLWQKQLPPTVEELLACDVYQTDCSLLSECISDDTSQKIPGRLQLNTQKRSIASSYKRLDKTRVGH